MESLATTVAWLAIVTLLPADLDPLERHLLTAISDLDHNLDNRFVPEPGLKPLVAAELFEAQVGSRCVDHSARRHRATQGLGYYTIGSAGHESNAAVAMALRPTDPALLHYRSGGFYFGRSSQVANQDPVGDICRGMLARTTDQISGGRHKVFGNTSLHIIPQTSTIASHCPRAVGLALSFEHRLPQPGGLGWPEDSVVVCSFGDASLNHSTTQGSLNWAGNAAHQGRKVPILFVCEDNGYGISVPTPPGWVEASTAARSGFLWASAEGDQPGTVMSTVTEMTNEIRATGQPGFLHLKTVRYLGHAGTDVESSYRAPTEIQAGYAKDPILATAREIVASGICTGANLVDWYLERQATIDTRMLSIATEPALSTAVEVMKPLQTAPSSDQRDRIVADIIGHSTSSGKTLAQAINQTLQSVLTANPNALVFGEDVGVKGGVYGVTRGLQKTFGFRQVFDTILDEQSVLGMALGSALNGFLPIPEIEYLAYLHNAEDQLRGEAATLAFFSQGQYHNPMVIRIAGYGYQRGFGGHFHNDNSVAVLRDIPGIVIASPSHPDDAGPVLAACVAAAETDGAVCVYLEPIARYHTTDLHAEGDGLWLSGRSSYDSALDHQLGSARTHGSGIDGTIITWGNGCYLSLQAQRQLWDIHGQDWRVVDLRWLAPLPIDDMLRGAAATGRVLIADETRRTGGVGEGLIAALVEGGFTGPLTRVAAEDSLIPLGEAANLVMISTDQLVEAALNL